MTNMQCIMCFNYFGNLECEAFPNGIPEDILIGKFDHRTPYPNSEHPTDNGIRFEPIEES